MTMTYRREIDGLRAVAVLPVILFHGGFTVFSGGFVGVDVFFVISGYLITGILIGELDAGTFSIARFYERRVRRILPALFLVMACTLPFALLWMLPQAFKEYAQSLVAVTAFVSNVLFWRQNGYFAAAADEKPLLHTWSLAVEEQYYLAFPVFLWLLWRFGSRRVFYAVAGIAAVSLVLSEWAWRFQPAPNFYLAPTRAWELLAGSLCAFAQFHGAQVRRPQWRSNVLSLLGLALILFAVFAYDSTTPIPSLYALAPVGGTALIILFGPAGTWTARLLSLGPFVGIGLISYSAYLWHQPLFAFARIRSVYEPDPWLMALLGLLSLGLAYLSWRFVEQPFRKRPTPLLPARPILFGTAAAVALAFVGIGLYGHLADGLRGRLSPTVLALTDAVATEEAARTGCIFESMDDWPEHPVADCLVRPGDTAQAPVMMYGDSHANALLPETRAAFEAAGMPFYGYTYAGCVPMPGFYVVEQYRPHDCDAFDREMEAYADAVDADVVVLSARWAMYAEGTRFDNGEGGVEAGGNIYIDRLSARDAGTSVDDPERRRRVVEGYVAELRRLLESRKVVLVYPIPEAGWNVPSQLAKLYMFGRAAEDLSTSYRRFRERNGAVIAAFDAIEHPNLYRVRPYEILCDSYIPGRCVNSLGGRALYYDDDHLGGEGAALVAEAIRRAVADSLEATATGSAEVR